MNILTREQILAAEDLTREPVAIPEWGGVVYVVALTGVERDAWEFSMLVNGKRDINNVRARLVVRCAVDADGNRLFLDTDADALGRKNGAALDRAFEVASRLNRLSRKDVEELAKNSQPSPSAASTTA